MSTSINKSNDPHTYLAIITIPITPQPAEAIATDCYVSQRYLVGEYSTLRTANDYAHKAAVKHEADSYSVLFPQADDKDEYHEIRERLRANKLPDYSNYITNQ